MYRIILNLHTFLVFAFLLFIVIKGILLLSGNKELLAKLKRIGSLVDMILGISVVASGIYLIVSIGMGNIGGWFHLKLLLVVLAIPCAIIGFKKQSKALVIISLLLFAYIVLLAFSKSATPSF